MKYKLMTVGLLMLSATAAAQCPAHLQGEYRRLHAAETVDMCELLDGKTALVVNTASHCGFTSQFEALEAVHQSYKDQGLVVVGFASDSFNQAAKTEEEAATICYTNFGVTFTMLAPTKVTGSEANALFTYLAQESEEPGWNFNKYVVAGDTGQVTHFDSQTKPDSEKITQAIEAALR